MKRSTYIFVAFLTLVFCVQMVLAQTGNQRSDFERELNRLQEKIHQVSQLARLFPNSQLSNIIQSAREQYQLAKQAYLQGRLIKARAHLKLGFGILAKVYRELRNNPFLKAKFKEALDSKIQEAEMIVSRSQNPEAGKLLNRARYYRQRAYQFSNLNQPELAYKHYLLAIFFADNAMNAVRGETTDNIANLDRYFENSKSLLLQAGDLLKENFNSTARDILRQAEFNFRQARRLYDEHRPRQAMQKLQMVNRLLYRVLDLLEKRPGAMTERLESDLAVVEESISELHARVNDSNDPSIQRLYERLVFLTAAAKQKYQAQNTLAARQQLRIANRLLLQIQRRLDHTGDLSGNRIREQLQTARFMLDALKRNALTDQVYQQLLALLENNLKSAESAQKEGKSRQALQLLKIFNNLALKLDQMRTAQDKETKTIEQVQNNLNRLKEMLNNQPAEEDAHNLQAIKYRNANRLYQIASDAFEKGNYRLCWQITKMALILLTQ